jgi:tetratricopeptide (TPR) repeat protein
MSLPAMKATGRVAVADLGLTAQEARIASQLEGIRSPQQLAEGSQDPDLVARTLYLLSQVELTSFAMLRAREPTPTGTPEAKGGPAAKSAQVSAAEVAALQATLDKMLTQNHFEVLGLDPAQTNAAAVKKAYLMAVKAYHPDAAPADAPDLKAVREKIFARVTDANAVLSDEKARQAYAEDLAAGIDGDEKVDVEAIFKSEELFAKACIVVKARKYQEGLRMLEDAIALNGEDAEFWAWRAWAYFMTQQDRKAILAASVAELQKALKKSPKCAPAAYFAGQMYKLVGDNPTALKWFQKAVEMDPQHFEASREAKALAGK